MNSEKVAIYDKIKEI
jgi:hypothetical protein